MLSASKQSGGRVIASLSGQFHHARVQLTLIYLAILITILFLSSYTIYSQFSSRLQHRFEGFQPSFQRKYQLPPGGSAFIVPTPEDVQGDLVQTLYIVNGLLLLIAGIFSYWLAGTTLEPIQAAYNRQRRFLGDASHELRTPLAILQTDLENELADKNVKGAVRERAVSHLDEVGRMSNLVGDLLTLSRLDEEGESSPRLRGINIVSVIEEVTERLKTVAERSQVELVCRDLPTATLEVLADKELLLQVFSNIIKNAIFYNKVGGQVTVTAMSQSGQVTVVITDTGVGISKEDIPKISERFYRSDKSRSRQTGGSGLGLSIVQAALDRLDGSMNIKSRMAKGTTVELTFPLSRSS